MIKENTPTIETKNLILRKFTENDVEDIWIIHSDEEVNKFLPWFVIKTMEEAKEYFNNKILPQYDRDIAYFYAITLKENHRVVGYIQINDIGGSNDMGYGLGKKYWHKGIVSEACAEVVHHLKKVHFPFITATHDINNPYSGEVMKKIGMTYRYSYEELCQPKNFLVNFRMYQLNLDGNENRLYTKYWDKYDKHYIEDLANSI